ADGRLEILRVHTRKMPLSPEVNLAEIAARCEGYVGSDLAALCREAGLTAIRENQRASMITPAHFEAALHQIHASCDPESLKFYEEFAKQSSRDRVARRRESPVEGIYR
ncbi:ATPase, AAA-type, core domain protein, partial [mine drainage metagenome]